MQIIAPRTYPQSINVTTMSAYSAMVSWQPMSLIDRNGIIQQYRISYNSNKWNHSGVVNAKGGTTTFLIHSLIPYTTYNFAIKAATVIGFGPESPIIRSMTYQAGKGIVLK